MRGWTDAATLLARATKRGLKLPLLDRLFKLGWNSWSGVTPEYMRQQIKDAYVEIERLRDLVHLCSGFLDPDSPDPHVRAALDSVRREMSPIRDSETGEKNG